MTVVTAATRFLLAGVKMTFPSPSSAASKAAASRICQLSSTSSLSSSSIPSPDLGASSAAARPLFPPKRVLLLRHGQAVHNPRAEAAREGGCSFDTFFRLMEEDDEFDAPLTALGENQAKEAGVQVHIRRVLRNIDMVVSSPLSRALHTADLICPPPDTTGPPFAQYPRRVCIEHFREINGRLLNAQRLPRSELERKFPHWCFRQIPASDESWTEDLEPREACGERGHRGLLWIMGQREENVLLVCHGGLLSYTMNDNPGVVVVDGRRTRVRGDRCVTKRFGNCEMREFVVTVWDSGDVNENESAVLPGLRTTDKNTQPVITLEEVTMDVGEDSYLNDGGNSGIQDKVDVM